MSGIAQVTDVANAFSTTLTAGISATDTTITVDSTGDLTAPCYLIIEPLSGTKREVVLCDSNVTATTFVLSGVSKRGLDAPAVSHLAGAKVISGPVAQHIDDLNARVDDVDRQLTVGASEPGTPQTGDLWVDTTAVGGTYTGDFDFTGDVDIQGTLGNVAAVSGDIPSHDGTSFKPKSLAELDIETATAHSASVVTERGISDATYIGVDDRGIWLNDEPGVTEGGVVECGVAVQTAITRAESLGVPLRGAGVFKIGSNSLTFKKTADLYATTFDYSGTGVAVTVGDATSGITRQRISIGRVVNSSKAATGWGAVAGSVGVKIVDTNRSFVEVKSVTKFETGLLLHGQARGTAYNQIKLGELSNNKVNLSFTSSAVGWTNQNLFLGGSFTHEPAEGTAVAGTRHVLMTNSEPSEADGNVFLNSSFESSAVVEYDLECHGLYNSWLGCRWEHNGDNPKVYWNTGAIGNVIRDGFKLNLIEVTTDATALSNKVVWSSSGDVETIIIDPAAMTSVLGTTALSNITRHPVFNLAPDAGLGFTVTFPKNWKKYDVELVVSHDNASSGTTSWLFRPAFYGNGDTIATPAGGTSRTVTLGTARVVTVTTLDPGLSVTASKQMTANLLRVTGGTFSGTASVLAVVLRRAA